MRNLYKLDIKDTNLASEILAKAFINYPPFEYVFPDIDERKKKLAKVLKFLLKCGICNGVVVAPSKNLEGISIWYKSENLNNSFVTILKSGFISLLFSMRMDSLKRFLSLGNKKKKHRNQIIKNKYYFLDMIGVAPEYKNKGYGKLMIQEMMKLNNNENLPVYLETSNFDNIKYYTQYGFGLIDEYNIYNFKTFCMIKN
jgi:ribosomal protein S18 acetylase RimI-like enzyme